MYLMLKNMKKNINSILFEKKIGLITIVGWV